MARLARLIIVMSSALMVAREEQGREVDVIEIPDGDPDTIYFPRQEKSDDYDSADAHGTIRLVDGCLRLVAPPTTDYLIIWPHDFELRVQSEEVVVLNSQDSLVARVGELAILGGSGVPDSSDDEIRGCSGPFWNSSPMVLHSTN